MNTDIYAFVALVLQASQALNITIPGGKKYNIPTGGRFPEQANVNAWSAISTTEKETEYIVSSLYKSLNIVPGSIVASNFNELATGSPRISVPIGEVRVCFLSIHERGLQKLIARVSG